MTLLWVLVALGWAEEPEAPSFEAWGEPGPEVPAPLLEAFGAVLGVHAPDAGPIVVNASPARPSLALVHAVVPRSVGLDDRPPAEAEFLLALAPLAPADRLAPVTAMRLADRLYTGGRRAVASGREGGYEPWMEAALPLYRQAATTSPRHPDRLALRLAWAARLGGGEAADLELSSALLADAPDTSWATEARLALAEAWMQPTTWDDASALGALQRASSSAGPELAPWASYALGWAWVRAGDPVAATAAWKATVQATRGEPTSAPGAAALRDLARLFEETGLLDDGTRCGPLGDRATVRASLRRLAVVSLEQGRTERAVELLRRLVLDGGAPSELIVAVAAASTGLDAEDRIALFATVVVPAFSTGAGLPDEARRLLAEVLAVAGAELHYGRLEALSATEREQARWAYATSLGLDPDHPRRAAIELLAAALR